MTYKDFIMVMLAAVTAGLVLDHVRAPLRKRR
jgi:hypothetical protein